MCATHPLRLNSEHDFLGISRDGDLTVDGQRFDLAIEGMTCSACSARLERVLNNAAGVGEALVNLALERAMIRTDSPDADLQTIIGVVRRSGFDVGTETGAFHVDRLADGRVAEEVEAALRAVPGVLDVELQPAAERVDVTAVSLMVPDAALSAAVRAAGHELTAQTATGRAERAHRQTVRERRILIFAALLTAPFMVAMASMPFMDEASMWHLPPWLELALALPLQFGVGLRFYRGAVNSLRGGGANMDVLVALGTSAAFFYSLYLLFALGHAAAGQLYFEASAVIITLILVGKHLEARAKRGTAAAIQELLDLQPATALVRLEDGSVEQRPCHDIAVGDVVTCRPGDKVPTDGVITRGEAEVNESLVTGESRPVAKGEGDSVIAGSINVNGFIDVETRAVGENSTLAKMIHLVENAQVAKPAVQRLVDRVSAVFVPTVVGIAVVTFVAHWLTGGGFEEALLSAAATLVIACPCALGLATPTAIMCGSSAAARAGILIKDTTTLEQAHSLTHVVFDKTGTLTAGCPVLAKIELLAGLDENEVLRVAASLQQGSEHPIAVAFRDAVHERGIEAVEVERFSNLVSRGVEGYVDGRRYLLGNERLYRDKKLDEPPKEKHQGSTEVWLGVSLAGGDALLAKFELVDELRPTAKAAVEALQQMNITPLLLSGDVVAVAQRIGAEIGIDKVHGEVAPQDKAEIIEELTSGGANVGMVGDGVNDAPALAQATVGIALGTGTDVAMETAGITLMRPDPRLVAGAVDASTRTFRKIKQNLFWAFIYNLIGLPLAAFGILNPSLAGAAMAFSSVSVVTNSLMLRSWKPKLH